MLQCRKPAVPGQREASLARAWQARVEEWSQAHQQPARTFLGWNEGAFRKAYLEARDDNKARACAARLAKKRRNRQKRARVSAPPVALADQLPLPLPGLQEVLQLGAPQAWNSQAFPVEPQVSAPPVSVADQLPLLPLEYPAWGQVGPEAATEPRAGAELPHAPALALTYLVGDQAAGIETMTEPVAGDDWDESWKSWLEDSMLE